MLPSRAAANISGIGNAVAGVIGALSSIVLFHRFQLRRHHSPKVLSILQFLRQ